MRFPPRSHLIIFILSVLGAFEIGVLADTLVFNPPSRVLAVREYDDRYDFIRPLLICQIDEQKEDKGYHALEGEVQSIIDDARSQKILTTASVYFRDLDSGKWMGINEEQGYHPASLLKVPIMLAYFKEARTNPEILNKRYLYNREQGDADPLTPPLLTSGNTYSVDELIRAMIVDSDNSATLLLVEKADPALLKSTYDLLGITDPYESANSGQTYEISAKKYGLFFRALYNSTLLSRQLSNKAFDLLSQTKFDLGLRAGTPTNITVAHKYGIRDVPNEDASSGTELSDCGVVYDTASPYLLCVMTHGTDPYKLAGVIKKIAEATYRSVAVEAR